MFLLIILLTPDVLIIFIDLVDLYFEGINFDINTEEVIIFLTHSHTDSFDVFRIQGIFSHLGSKNRGLEIYRF